MRIGREEAIGLGFDIGEIAASAAGDQNFRAGLGIVFEQQHALAARAGCRGTEQARRARADDDRVVNLAHLVRFAPGLAGLGFNNQRHGKLRHRMRRGLHDLLR